MKSIRKALLALHRILDNCEEIDKHLPKEECSGYNMLDDYFVVANELVEKSKYIWHDLLKDQDDLPSLLHQVIVCITYNGEIDYCIASKVDSKYYDSFNNGWTCIGDVIAWKEFEEFEAENES